MILIEFFKFIADQPKKQKQMKVEYMKKTILALAVVAGLVSFTGTAKAQPYGNWFYNNLTNVQNGGDRINSALRGLAESFQASSSNSIATVAFSLNNLSGATGHLEAALFNVSGSPLSYSFGAQIGSTAVFSTTDIINIYTAVDVSTLNWNIISGAKYAVALWGASDFNNPSGGAGGIEWVGGSGSSYNLDHHNNWSVGNSKWEDWGGVPSSFSVGLSSDIIASNAVPEPSTYALLGMGALGMGMAMRRKKTA
jgi:hypothetical protein